MDRTVNERNERRRKKQVQAGMRQVSGWVPAPHYEKAKEALRTMASLIPPADVDQEAVRVLSVAFSDTEYDLLPATPPGNAQQSIEASAIALATAQTENSLLCKELEAQGVMLTASTAETADASRRLSEALMHVSEVEAQLSQAIAAKSRVEEEFAKSWSEWNEAAKFRADVEEAMAQVTRERNCTVREKAESEQAMAGLRKEVAGLSKRGEEAAELLTRANKSLTAERESLARAHTRMFSLEQQLRGTNKDLYAGRKLLESEQGQSNRFLMEIRQLSAVAAANLQRVSTLEAELLKADQARDAALNDLDQVLTKGEQARESQARTHDLWMGTVRRQNSHLHGALERLEAAHNEVCRDRETEILSERANSDILNEEVRELTSRIAELSVELEQARQPKTLFDTALTSIGLRRRESPL